MAVSDVLCCYSVCDSGVGAGDSGVVIAADVEYYTDDSAASGVSYSYSKSADY